MNNLEILAPAGDMQSFKCAVYNGANAIYLGLNNFNARIKADNFNKDNITDVVSFAHIYGVKVYLTINTLIKDDEVEDFLQTVECAINAKVDAFIIQDFGMAQLLRRRFKGIVLHASTQMGIHNLQGAMNLEKLGFTRVVLSRETKLEDIRLIHERTNLEIEYFVQGALCVAFSGNCYMSAIKNGNSGNRGKCLQLCRLPYKAYDNERVCNSGYLLSPKDLCLMSKIEELQEAGVTSFKIEGRLKRASYVAQTVRSFRKVVDSLNSYTRVDIAKEQKKIKEIFSRGEFNENAYLYDNFDIINPKINNHEGKKIGKVVNVSTFKDIYKITLDVNERIGEGDALRIIGDKKIVSIGVGNVNLLKNNLIDIFSTQNPQNGSIVYLLKSEAKESNLTGFERKLHINMHFIASVGNKACIKAKYNQIEVEVWSTDVVAKAINKPLVYEDVYKQVNKLNDTNFELDSLICEMSDNIFIAVSTLNDIRRRLIEELSNKILSMYELKMPKIEVVKERLCYPQIKTPKENFVIIDDVVQVGNLSDSNIIISPKMYTYEHIFSMMQSLEKLGYKKEILYLNLPIVSTSQEQIKIEKILSRLGISIVVNNYSQIHLAKNYKAIAGSMMNVYNTFTANELLNMGFDNFVYSLENIRTLNNDGIVYAKGCPELMTMCHCPIQVIKGGNCSNCKYSDGLVLEDDKNNRYRIRRIKIDHCYFQLVSEELYERKSNHGKLIDLRSL